MKFDEAVSEIKRRVDLATVVGRYVRLKKAGNGWVGLCPFHDEKTPSFNVRSDKGVFKCFGCGASGDLFSFLELKTGQLFADNVKQMAAEIGIKIDLSKTPRAVAIEETNQRLLQALELAQSYFKNNLLSSVGHNHALAYLLKERGLKVDEIDKRGLGFAGNNDQAFMDFLKKNNVDQSDAVSLGLIRPGRHGHYSFFNRRITIPIFDHRGRIVAFAGRTFGPHEEGRPKYINSPSSLVYEKSHILFGLHESLQWLKQGLPAVLVEGYFDVVAIQRLDVPAVAPCGTSLTEEHVQLLSRYTKSVLLCFDKDAAGRAAQKKALMLLLRHGFHVRAVELSGKDPDSIVLEGKGEELKKSLMQAKDAIELLCREVSRISIFGMSERLAALEALIPYLAAPSSTLASRQYVKLAARILGEEERVLLKEVAKISPQILHKERAPAPAIETKPPVVAKVARINWTNAEKLLGRALLAHPRLSLSIESGTRHELNFELSDFIDRLVQLLTQFPDQDAHVLMHKVPIARGSEWVGLLLENARHPDVVSNEDANRILEDLRSRSSRKLALEEMMSDHADLAEAEDRGDLVSMRRVLTAQSERLKKMDLQHKSKPGMTPTQNQTDERTEPNSDAFEELRWT